MPSNILPYVEDGPCQICGEPTDDEMGEFALPVPDINGEITVYAHAQCGLDHNLQIA